MADEQFLMHLQITNAGPCPENSEKASVLVPEQAL